MCSVTRPGFYWLQNGCQQQRLQESTQTNTHEPLPVAAEGNGLTNLPSLSPLCGSPGDFSPALTNPVSLSQWHPAWLQHCLMPSCVPCGLATLSSLVHVVFSELVSPGPPFNLLNLPKPSPETSNPTCHAPVQRALDADRTSLTPFLATLSNHPAIGRPSRLPAAVANPRDSSSPPFGVDSHNDSPSFRTGSLKPSSNHGPQAGAQRRRRLGGFVP